MILLSAPSALQELYYTAKKKASPGAEFADSARANAKKEGTAPLPQQGRTGQFTKNLAKVQSTDIPCSQFLCKMIMIITRVRNA
jgi:hypothetical protein